MAPYLGDFGSTYPSPGLIKERVMQKKKSPHLVCLGGILVDPVTSLITKVRSLHPQCLSKPPPAKIPKKDRGSKMGEMFVTQLH